jgi:pyoverdine/dityrosine biosynthesis protein Dit1
MQDLRNAVQGCATPSRETEINNQFNRLESLRSELVATFTELEQRLNPVLKQLPCNPSDNKKTATLLTPLADKLRSHNEFLEGLILAVRDVTNRCEL